MTRKILGSANHRPGKRRNVWALLLAQRASLAIGLATEVLLSPLLGPLALESLKFSKPAADRLAVDAVLASEFCLSRARSNPSADSPDVPVGQFGGCSHAPTLASPGTFHGTYTK